jgi:hypothetical protein
MTPSAIIAAITASRLDGLRPIRKPRANIAGNDQFGLAIKVTDGAFVFVNDFAFVVQP